MKNQTFRNHGKAWGRITNIAEVYVAYYKYWCIWRILPINDQYSPII